MHGDRLYGQDEEKYRFLQDHKNVMAALAKIAVRWFNRVTTNRATQQQVVTPWSSHWRVV
jgi:hypothetical protein